MRTAFPFCMIFSTQISNIIAKNIKFSTLPKSKMAALFELANFFIFEKLAIFFYLIATFDAHTENVVVFWKLYLYILSLGFSGPKTRWRSLFKHKMKKVLQKSYIFVDFWIFCWRSFKVIGYIYTSPRPCGHFGTNMMSIGYIMAEIQIRELWVEMWPYPFILTSKKNNKLLLFIFLNGRTLLYNNNNRNNNNNFLERIEKMLQTQKSPTLSWPKYLRLTHKINFLEISRKFKKTVPIFIKNGRHVAICDFIHNWPYCENRFSVLHDF